MRRSFIVSLCAAALWYMPVLQAQPDAALIEALREGGHVIVMRHARSPEEPPAPAAAQADNTKGERQLDAQGRADATAMGDALRRLGIPIGEAGSSPTYRALETARLMGLSTVTPYEELSNEGMRDSSAEYGAWLMSEVLLPPATGNRLLITHQPNIRAAFPDIEDVEDGEALIFAPDGGAAPVLRARIKIGEWPALPSAAAAR
jgi:phosphohistidine phosphatase SixA